MRFLVLLFFPAFIFSQNIKREFPEPSQSNVIIIGYQFSGDPSDIPEEERMKSLHIIGLSYVKVSDGGGRHQNSRNYYVGSDFIFNYDKFLLSPKVGVDFCGNAMCLGTELNFYTDFHKISPRISPFFGIGGNGFRLYLGYTVNFFKSDYFPPSTLNLGLTLPVYNLTSKKFLGRRQP